MAEVENETDVAAAEIGSKSNFYCFRARARVRVSAAQIGKV
jgi:hypothetical protein